MSAVNVTLLAFAATCRTAEQQRRSWCTHGAQPQTRLTSGLRSHDGTDRRTDAKSCSALYILCVSSAYWQLPVYRPTLRDVTTLYPPLPPTSHIVTPAWTPSPFERDIIYGSPLKFGFGALFETLATTSGDLSTAVCWHGLHFRSTL